MSDSSDTLLSSFNEEWYKNTYEDVLLSGLTPIEHFKRYGILLGRKPCPEKKYKNDIFLETNDTEVTTRNEYPAVNNNIPVEIIFDHDYYLKENPDVASSGLEPEYHYYNFGEKEGRKPNSYFCPKFYQKLNADVRSAGISLFSHYVSHGFHEGRLGNLIKSLNKSNHKKTLLFIGHDGIQCGSEVVLLEIIKWFSTYTDRKIKVLLLSPGPLANDYSLHADVYVLPNKLTIDSPTDFAEFINEKFEFCYLNTVVSGAIFPLIDKHNLLLKGEVITHIHEMEKVLRDYEDSLDHLKNHSTHFISASPSTTEDLINFFHIKKEKISTIPAFIKLVDPSGENRHVLKKNYRQYLNIPENAFLTMGCGTVYWRKGPDIFLDTAIKVTSQVDNSYFVWIGNGPDLDNLRENIPENLRDRIKFIGSRNNANELVAASDVFFLPSREDPFPLVVMEAAQHIVPTICFGDCTGVTKFIQEDAGFILPTNDGLNSATLLIELSKNTQLVESKGTIARNRVVEHYTSDVQCLNIYKTIEEQTSYIPSVSVIVPFYNHEKYVTKRLETILNQDIKDLEIILLDDSSQDNTLAQLMPFSKKDARIIVLQNNKNSGSPFIQWQKGIDSAKSDIIWIAEGDDYCSSNFLTTLLPYFKDEMVSIATAKTEIVDENEVIKPNALNSYLNSVSQDEFIRSFVKDGFNAVNESLGAICTLVNGSGNLIRKKSISKDILDYAKEFKMCGDWIIYLHALKNGKLAYNIDATNYFRRHSSSTTNKIEGTSTYFIERSKISKYVFSNFNVSRQLINKAFKIIDDEWRRFSFKNENLTLADYYNKSALVSKANIVNNRLHIAFYAHGLLFSKGGIEKLAVQLANHFCEQGHLVTIYCRKHSNVDSVYPLYNSVKTKGIFDETDLENSVHTLRKDLLESKVDVFIPMLSEWLFDPVISATTGTGISVIASEHNNPWVIEEKWWNHEDRIRCFKQVDKIHLLLERYTDSLTDELKKKSFVITNAVEKPAFVNTQAQRSKVIIAVGRLAEQKRFDRFIDAIYMIKDKMRELGWVAEIYGDGHLKHSLNEQISSLNIADLICLKGNTSYISDIMNTASLYVMPSEFEGLSIAMLEAMSYALPVICFEECLGVENIIINNHNGFVVNDIYTFAAAIESYITDHSKLEAHAFNSKSICDGFSLENLFSKWDLLIEEATLNTYLEMNE
ncbi:TPA: glycosyltransferase [Citrobacter freundii]